MIELNLKKCSPLFLVLPSLFCIYRVSGAARGHLPHQNVPTAQNSRSAPESDGANDVDDVVVDDHDDDGGGGGGDDGCVGVVVDVVVVGRCGFGRRRGGRFEPSARPCDGQRVALSVALERSQTTKTIRLGSASRNERENDA